MIDNFLFSVNSSLPIFLTVLVGWSFRRFRIIDESFVKSVNTIVFYVALPIKLFMDISRVSLNEAYDINLLAFIFISTIIGVFIAWIIGKLTAVDSASMSAFLHGSFRSNYLFIGFSLMENLTGSINPKAPIVAAFFVPLCNVVAVLILASSRLNPQLNVRPNVSRTVLKILKNPLIIAVILGVIFSVIDFDLPTSLNITFSYFSSITLPLALLGIGASFHIKSFGNKIRVAIVASIIKLIIFPLITVITAYIFGFGNADILLIFAVFGVPAASTTYIMTAAMNGDYELSSSIVVLSTLFSTITITVFVFLFRISSIV